MNKCLVVASLNAGASWGHNFARQSKVCGICRVLCVMLPIVLYRCRRSTRNQQQPSTAHQQSRPKNFPVPKPFKAHLSRRRVTPPPPQTHPVSNPPPPLRSNACLVAVHTRNRPSPTPTLSECAPPPPPRPPGAHPPGGVENPPSLVQDLHLKRRTASTANTLCMLSYFYWSRLEPIAWFPFHMVP